MLHSLQCLSLKGVLGRKICQVQLSEEDTPPYVQPIPSIYMGANRQLMCSNSTLQN